MTQSCKSAVDVNERSSRNRISDPGMQCILLAADPCTHNSDKPDGHQRRSNNYRKFHGFNAEYPPGESQEREFD